LDLVTKAMYKGMDETKLKKRHAQEEKDASRKVIGDMFQDCMEADDDTDRKKAQTACMEIMKTTATKFGIHDDTKALLKRKHADLVREAFKCAKADRKQCRDDACAKAKNAGMKGRECAVVQSLAIFRQVAEGWSTCMDGNDGEDGAEKACDDLALTEFMAATGAMEKAWTKQSAMRAKRLGKAIRDGVDTLIVKKEQVAVQHGADGTKCDDAVAAKVLKMAVSVASKTISGAEEQQTRAANPPCILRDEVPTYRWVQNTKGKDDEEIDTIADKFIEEIVALGDKAMERRLRRLEALSSTNAAQDTEECPDNDDTCGQTDEAMAANEAAANVAASSTKTAVSAAAATSLAVNQVVLFLVAVYASMFC